MKKQKITSIFTLTLAGVLLTSPLSYVDAEETVQTSPTGPTVGRAQEPSTPAATERITTTERTLPTTTERTTTTTERATTTERTTTTEERTTTEESSEEEKIVTRWVDERYKFDKKKDLKPEKKADGPTDKGPDIDGYEFVETDDKRTDEVLHIYKKKEVTYRWITEKEGKEEVLSEKKTIDETTEKDIESKDEDKLKELEFDKKDVSRDKLTVKFIYKKKGEKSSSNDSTKEDDKKSENNKESGSKSEDKKDGDKPESTTAPKTEDKTKEGDTSKAEGDSKPVENNATSTTVSTTVAPAATEAVTTATNNNGEQNAIVQTTATVPATTKKDEVPTPPQYISIFLNEETGYAIINPRDGKDSIAIAGYGFVRTAVSGDGITYYHYYRPSEGDKASKKLTIWMDAYSGEYILTSKQGQHPAGKVAGYTHINTKSLGDVTVHYYEKNTKLIYNWSYHRDIDTGEIIYYDYNRVGWHHPLPNDYIRGYVYVNTDSWTDSNGVTYFTHYYKQVAKVNYQVDPAKVFTVWVDEYGDQILPSRMGSHEAGELEGYEFDKTVSINSGYGIAHVFKNTSGDKKLAGKDKDKSVGYRVRSMLPGTNAAGENSILPMVIIGTVGAAVAGGVYYFMRRRENND